MDERIDLLSGWGRTSPTAARRVSARVTADVDGYLASAGTRGLIARGLGRSYGDAAQNAGGLVAELASCDRILELDEAEAKLRVEAGASVGALLRVLLPLGWFLPVVPATRHVTIGGLIAADVHGKNHTRDGSTANHVAGFTLRTPKGALDVSPDSDPDLFWATAGAMGLTGVVTEATIRLMRIDTSLLVSDTRQAADLEEVLALMASDSNGRRYSVAWLDALAPGGARGRGIVTRADHAPASSLDGSPAPWRFRPRSLLAALPGMPGGVLNRFTVRAFNELWYHKSPRRREATLTSIAQILQPLDAVPAWNRLYGRRGMIQYQFVVPEARDEVISTALERLSAARCDPFFTTLKRFGRSNPGPLSFPLQGFTLSLDFPARMPGLGAALDGIDELVAEAGGRVYLAKDSRLRPELLPAMYPDLDRLGEVRERVDPSGIIQSDLGRRLRLC